MVKIGICDDDQNTLNLTRKIIEDLIIHINFEAKVILVTKNQNLVYQAIENSELDILFLDVDFANEGENGIKFAKKLREINKEFRLIFFTGHFEYSLIAFKCKTFDYILKPLNQENLFSVLKRLKLDFEEPQNIFLKVNKDFSIRTCDIIFIERNKSKTVIYTKDQCYETVFSLNIIKCKLPDSFYRVHRSYIINEDNIKSIDNKNKIILFKNNMCCPIGKFKYNKI